MLVKRFNKRVKRVRRVKTYKNKSLVRAVSRIINRKIETKSATYSATYNGTLVDGGGVYYNLVSSLNGGTGLPQGTGEYQRIGDRINCRGIKLRICLTNYYGIGGIMANSEKCSVRIVVYGTKSTSPSRGQLFRNDSYALVQEVDTDENKVIYDRIHTVKLNTDVGTSHLTHTNVRMWLPGFKFGRKGMIQFQDNTASTLKGYNYYLALFATFPGDQGETVVDTLWNGVFYFKDA